MSGCSSSTRRLRPHQSLITWLLIAPLSWACGESLDPHSPDGALRSFAQTVIQGSSAEIYAQLSAPSKVALTDLAELSRVLNKRVDALPLKTQAWARAEAMPPWMSERADLSPERVFEGLAKDMIKAMRAAPSEEVMQSFNGQRIVFEDAKEGVVSLKTRGFPQLKMRKEGELWRFAELEEALTLAVEAAHMNIKMIESNKAEIQRRQRLDLPMPKAP